VQQAQRWFQQQGLPVLAASCDLRDEAATRAFVARVARELGPIDVLRPTPARNSRRLASPQRWPPRSPRATSQPGTEVIAGSSSGLVGFIARSSAPLAVKHGQ